MSQDLARLFKRAVDIFGASAGLVALSPLLASIWGLGLAVHGWPPLFRQPRPGKDGRVFTLVKFRTMNQRTDSKGELLPDAERLTALGAFLRSTSLDELPELWNVLRGDMSLVGPRPLLVRYLERYTPEQARRHDVRPGITGWAQVCGRNALTWEEKLKLDVWYVDNWSLLLDFEILLRTVRAVLSREGISAVGEATMPEFMGTSRPDS